MGLVICVVGSHCQRVVSELGSPLEAGFPERAGHCRIHIGAVDVSSIKFVDETGFSTSVIRQVVVSNSRQEVFVTGFSAYQPGRIPLSGDTVDPGGGHSQRPLRILCDIVYDGLAAAGGTYGFCQPVYIGCYRFIGYVGCMVRFVVQFYGYYGRIVFIGIACVRVPVVHQSFEVTFLGCDTIFVYGSLLFAHLIGEAG